MKTKQYEHEGVTLPVFMAENLDEIADAEAWDLPDDTESWIMADMDAVEVENHCFIYADATFDGLMMIFDEVEPGELKQCTENIYGQCMAIYYDRAADMYTAVLTQR